MADRSITARLRLVYNEFTKGTDAAAKGLRGIGDQAKKTSTSVGRDWGAIGKSVSGLGDSLTTRVSLPLIGLGALATKAAGDFDAAFVQMQTLAGVSADEVEGLKESVLGLAGETGKAPQELAEAMFFLQSSGLDAAGAMEALEISAKASAAGLGDTVVLADAASSVMLAYAESGMTAAEAMDTLIATAKAGKAEPAAIATQLSKLIPISAALDISFQDVGGALAALSTKAFSAEQGATGLAAVMSKLQKPSQQAQEQLDAVGLSGDRLKDLLAEKGLLGTLTTLKERLGDNGFVRFLEDQEAIRAGVALTTGDMEKMEEIFGQVADSAGATESAFATWAESMGAENAKAFAQFQIALIRLGEVIAPIAADLMSFAADVIGGFGKLPEPVQKLAVAFAAVMAAVGPLMSVGGRLISVWSSAMKVFDNFTSSGGRAFADAMNAGTEATNNLGRKMSGLQAAAGMAAGAAGIGAVLFAIDEMGRAAHEAEIEKLTEDFMEGADMADLFADALDGDAFTMSKVNEILGDLIDTNLEAAERFVDAAEAAGMEEEQIEAARKAIEDKRTADSQAAADAGANQEAIEGTTEAMADQEQAVNEAEVALQSYLDTLRGTFDPLFAMSDAMESNRAAHEEMTTKQLEAIAAQDAYNDAVAKYGEDSKAAREASAENMAAQQALTDAQRNARSAVVDLQAAATQLRMEIEANGLSVDDAIDQFIDMATQMGYTRAEAEVMAGDLGLLDDEATRLTRPRPPINIRTDGTRASRSALTSVRDAAHSIPGSRTTHVSVTGALTAIGALDNLARKINQLNNSNVRVSVGGGGGLILHEGGVVPGPRGQEIAAVLQAGEEVLPYDDPRHSANLGRLSGHMSSGAALAGGVGDTIVFNLPNLITPDSRKFREMVVYAVNVAARKGRGLNVGRAA